MLNKKQSTLIKIWFVAFRQFGANFPTQIASTFYFSQPRIQPPQKIKRACNPTHGFSADIVHDITVLYHDPRRRASYNSTYPKGGVSCSKDSFVVNGSLVFQIKFCGKSPALRVAAKRYMLF